MRLVPKRKRGWWAEKTSHVYGRASIRFCAAMLVCVFTPLVLTATGLLTPPTRWYNVIPHIVQILVAIGYLVWMFRTRWRAAAFDYRLCKHCRYDLRAIEEPGRCPECGEEFDAKSLFRYWTRMY